MSEVVVHLRTNFFSFLAQKIDISLCKLCVLCGSFVRGTCNTQPQSHSESRVCTAEFVLLSAHVLN